MDVNAKRELAKVILKCEEAREASWNGKRYTRSHWNCAHDLCADADVAELVGCMLTWSGEHVDWAHKVLG